MQTRQLKGTTDWTEYSITLPVHPGAQQLYFGALVAGTGRAWVADVRLLVDGQHIPSDVTIQVLTQAREGLIKRTLDSLRGAPRAIVHLYNSTNSAQRRIVFGMSRKQVRDLAVQGTTWIQEAAATVPETDIVLEYSPEGFSMTELDFAVEVVDAVVETWSPSQQRKMIVNLPATVESSMPNVYADQVEWMATHIARRGDLVESAKP